MKIFNGIKLTDDNVQWQPGMVLYWDMGRGDEINITSEASNTFYEWRDGTWDVTNISNDTFAVYGRFSTFEAAYNNSYATKLAWYDKGIKATEAELAELRARRQAFIDKILT